jgi:hypothetical protein
MKRRPSLVTLLLGLSVLLALAGHALGSLVKDSVPAIVTGYIQLVLALGAYLYLSVKLLNAEERARDQSPAQRGSRRSQQATIMLIGSVEVLAVVVGILSEIAAESLPAQVKRYSLLFFVGTILLSIGTLILIYRLQNAPEAKPTNRARFLKNLQRQYHEEKDANLHGMPSIPLGLLSEGPSPSATMSMSEIFAHAGGGVLILGDPGAGKSMLLVELALDLALRARSDDTLPVPVIFNLSSWAIDRASLATWMAGELVLAHAVPRKVAEDWVHDDKVLPLLDGLDTVDPPARGDCIKTINAFAQAHHSLHLVTCSRTDTYRGQALRLSDQTVVRVQALSDAQIMDFAGQDVARDAVLQSALRADPELREVLRTPLMLSLVMLTYRNLPDEEVPAVGDRDVWRRDLLQEFVSRRIDGEDHPSQTLLVSPEEATTTLTWLAQQMRSHDLSTFFVEQLQADWLPDASSVTWHQRRVTVAGRALVGLMGAVLGALMGALAVGQGGALIGMVIGGLVFSQRTGSSIAWSADWQERWPARGLRVGLAPSLGPWSAP